MRHLSKLAVDDVWPRRLAAALFAGVALATVSGCSSPCDNSFVSELPSPDGMVKAVVFTRDCGATVRTYTEVSVLAAGAALPSGSANALEVGDNPDHPIERSGPAIDVRLNWTSSRRLSISSPKAAAVDRRVASVSGVAVDYGTF